MEHWNDKIMQTFLMYTRIAVMCDTDWFEMDIEVGIAKNADISISY